jgi:hypothetical protein
MAQNVFLGRSLVGLRCCQKPRQMVRPANPLDAPSPAPGDAMTARPGLIRAAIGGVAANAMFWAVMAVFLGVTP